MKLSEFYRDHKVVEEGQWVDKIPGFDGLALYVRGDTNPDARAMRDKLTADWRAKNGEIAEMPSSDEAEINAKIVRDTILLDWKGIEDDDGNPVPVNKDLIGNRDYEDLSSAIMYASRRVGRNITKTREGDAKN